MSANTAHNKTTRTPRTSSHSARDAHAAHILPVSRLATQKEIAEIRACLAWLRDKGFTFSMLEHDTGKTGGWCYKVLNNTDRYTVTSIDVAVIRVKITPAVNQIEVNPFHQQMDTQKFLQDNNVQVEAWAPFAEGRNNIFQNELLLSLAAKHKVSVAQVILRWLVQRGIIALAKSIRKERMKENISVFDFELNTEEMAAIATLDTKTSCFFDNRDPEMVKWLGNRTLDV